MLRATTTAGTRVRNWLLTLTRTTRVCRLRTPLRLPSMDRRPSSSRICSTSANWPTGSHTIPKMSVNCRSGATSPISSGVTRTCASKMAFTRWALLPGSHCRVTDFPLYYECVQRQSIRKLHSSTVRLSLEASITNYQGVVHSKIGGTDFKS